MGNSLKNLSVWLICLTISAGLALPVATIIPVTPAVAQESGNLFQRLFRSNNKENRVKRKLNRSSSKKTRRKKSRRGPALAAAPKTPDKLENARVVLVVGDFLAGGLAGGLEVAFKESPGVRIVERSSGSSGIVRDDYYNWSVKLPEFLESDKPSVVVMMIGANDRQDFRTTRPKLRRRSDEWRKEYERRAVELASMVAERNIPLVWVGMPSFKSPRMSSDMVAYNDIYRRAVTGVDGAYVDIWDGFVNEAGAFVTSGPDINGQPARLRSADGINVTRAARRKIAFYAEKPLRKLLGDAVAPDIGELGPENLPQLRLDPLNSPLIDRTDPIALNDPELDGGEELLGATVEIETNVGANAARKLTIDGLAAPAKPGRADDFKWKPAPVEPADGDKTGSTTP